MQYDENEFYRRRAFWRLMVYAFAISIGLIIVSVITLVLFFTCSIPESKKIFLLISIISGAVGLLIIVSCIAYNRKRLKDKREFENY